MTLELNIAAAPAARPDLRLMASSINARRLELYNLGWTDQAIAVEQGVERCTIRYWRATRKLPYRGADSRRKSTKITAAEHARRMILYNAGWSDGAIAQASGGLRHNSILGWRRKHGLPCNLNPTVRSLIEHEKRLALHEEGKSDREIAEALNTPPGLICRWRKRHNLPDGQEQRRDVPRGGDAMNRISRFIDAPLRGYDQLDGHGMLADNSWSDWLEDMGATAW